MSKRLMLSIVVVLVITNIATLLFLGQSNSVLLEGDNEIKIETNKSVASIGNEDIAYEDWLSSLRESYGERHLRGMINHNVVDQLSKQKGIQINEKIIDYEISLLTTMQGVMTKKEAESIEKKWRKEILYRYKLEVLLTEDVIIPEEDIKGFYANYGKQYDFTASTQFSHIVVDNFETAEKVIKELDEGASFNLLAQEYSNDEETRSAGGYLGFFTKTSQFLPSGYYEAASEMEEYSYSDPFKTDNGIAIIYLHRSLPSITFTYEEMKDHIGSELGLIELEQSLNTEPLWEQLDIEWIYD